MVPVAGRCVVDKGHSMPRIAVIDLHALRHDDEGTVVLPIGRESLDGEGQVDAEPHIVGITMDPRLVA
jgi:hypothetical protein